MLIDVAVSAAGAVCLDEELDKDEDEEAATLTFAVDLAALLSSLSSLAGCFTAIVCLLVLEAWV